MATVQLITIDGLAEFRRDLRRLSADLPKALRLALNKAGESVIVEARPRVPTQSGRAARSLKARSTQTEVRVQGGGARVPYYAWLDFGGTREGRGGGKATRPFYSEGRIIYAAFHDVSDRGVFQETLTDALVEVGRQAGVTIEGA